MAPPSTCISWNLRPSISTSSSTGSKAPGIADDARRILRNRSSALGWPLDCQGADIPDHRSLGVEIGGADQQQAALVVFATDLLEHFLVGVLGDHLGERRGVGHGVVEQGGGEAAPAKDPVGGQGRVDLAQFGVVVGAKEGKGRDQGAGADAGHHLEAGPSPGRRPAVHQAGAERAVVAAARDREIVGGRQRRDRLAGCLQGRLLAGERAAGFLDHRGGVAVSVETQVGDAERLGELGVSVGNHRPAVGN